MNEPFQRYGQVYCDYSDTYIVASRTITITGAEANHATKRVDERE